MPPRPRRQSTNAKKTTTRIRRAKPSTVPAVITPSTASLLGAVPGPQSWLPLFLDFISSLHIESKETGDTILGDNLWGSQRRALQELSSGMDAGIRDFTNLKSRQLGECLDPDTRVLKANLTWERIADLKAGDEIVSVEEFPWRTGKRGSHHRKMLKGVVEAAIVVQRQAYRIVLDDGRSLVCTATHPWLTRGAGKGSKTTHWGAIQRKPGAYGQGIKKIKPGVQIRWITEPWAEPSYEDGWFGGMLDGEGSMYLPTNGGGGVNVSQKVGLVWDRLVRYADEHKYHYTIENDATLRKTKYGTTPVLKLCFTRADEIIRLLGQTRPSRFLHRDFWVGRELPGKKSGVGWATVVSITPVGEQPMIDLQTSVGTYIAEGFVSHNTTIFLAIDLFWLFLHPGIHGVLVIDEDGNRDKIRVILRQYARSLPRHMRYEIVDDNKTLMSFNVGGKLSILDFIVAGKRKSSLGASRAYRFAHLSEVANYGDPRGLENFLQTLSQGHPDRLFIKESTADGYNHWHSMCQGAKRDHLSQRFFFTGWWSRDDQSIPSSDPRFAEYMAEPWTEEELELQAEVAQSYGVLITDEQLAWYRWYSTKSLDEGMLHQTQPWTERQAFVLSGRSFFPLRKVEKDLAAVYEGAVGSEYDYDAYRYDLGTTVDTTSLEKVYTPEDADLKVWTDPVPWGRYAIGVDPAYGHSDWSDSHAISVCRCFADKLVLDAEYGSTEPETFQITWALAHIASIYEDCYVNYEVTGPGVAIKTELDRMKQILQSTMMTDIVKAKGWENVLDHIRWYLYHRPDSLSKGYAYGWRTNVDNKIAIMNELRDSYTNGLLVIRSARLLEQMQYIVQEGSEIGPAAKGRNHDDFVFALALAHRAWLEWIRPDMISEGYTYEVAMRDDEQRRRVDRPGIVAGIVGQWFDNKEKQRIEQINNPWAVQRGLRP